MNRNIGNPPPKRQGARIAAFAVAGLTALVAGAYAARGIDTPAAEAAQPRLTAATDAADGDRSPTEYYPALFGTPQGQPEAPIPTF